MMVFMLDEIFSIRTEKILNAMKIQTVKKNNLEIQFICGFKKKTHILVVSYHVFVKVRSEQVVWGTGFEILCP